MMRLYARINSTRSCCGSGVDGIGVGGVIGVIGVGSGCSELSRSDAGGGSDVVGVVG